jgi:hypothetical protein
MKTKPRARRMWANYYPEGRLGIYRTKRSATYFRGLFGGEAVPVAVIPLHDLTTLGDSMLSALTSLGVLPKRKGGRK